MTEWPTHMVERSTRPTAHPLRGARCKRGRLAWRWQLKNSFANESCLLTNCQMIRMSFKAKDWPIPSTNRPQPKCATQRNPLPPPPPHPHIRIYFNYTKIMITGPLLVRSQLLILHVRRISTTVSNTITSACWIARCQNIWSTDHDKTITANISNGVVFLLSCI